jgi:hypothetical protein
MKSCANLITEICVLSLTLCCRYIMQTYARPELVFTHGEGARLYDAHGKEYLDFAAGIAVNALGKIAKLSPLQHSMSEVCTPRYLAGLVSTHG